MDRLLPARLGEPLRPEDPPVVGSFRLEARLGAGGMGRVYLGRDPDGRPAAIKVIHSELAGDPGFRARFRREVAAAMSVAGRCTARVLGADPAADPPWLATEFIDGPSLRAAVARSGPMPVGELVALARGLAEALTVIHAAGLVHRDLKPANVLISPTGPKVIDFGVAWSPEGTQLTATGDAVGTPSYMAPEQVAATGPGSPAIDVFALGSILVFAATGQGPFTADLTAATMFRILYREPDLGGLPAPLYGLVLACLQKDPRQRPTAGRIVAVLDRAGPQGFDDQPTGELAVVAGRDPVPAPPPAPASAPPVRRRGRTIALSVVALLVVVSTTVATVAAVNGWFGPGHPGSGSLAAPATGGAVPAATTATSPVSTADQVQYVDKWCAAGDLLQSVSTTLGGFAVIDPDPQAAGDATVALIDELAATTATAVDDVTALHDTAPSSEVARVLGQALDQLTTGKAGLADARTVAARGPDAQTDALTHYTTAVASVAYGLQRVQQVELPAEYQAATASAPHCLARTTW